MTTILCHYTKCKYNDSCCVSNEEGGICKNSYIELYPSERIDDFGELECLYYKDDIEKPYECSKCQILKYGYIKLHNNDKIE